MAHKGKVLFISNSDGALFVFRRHLLQRLLQEGHPVSAITSAGPYVDKLRLLGVRTMTVDFAGTSASLWGNFRLFLRLKRLVLAEKPEIVHNFTHKPAIFGTLAARFSGVEKIFITVTGLGKLFAGKDLKTRLLRRLLLLQYRLALPAVTRVFFLNGDDRDFFVRRGLPSERAVVINGEGVDLQETAVPSAAEVARHRRALSAELGVDLSGKVVVLFNARALREKGVYQFYEAARQVRGISPRFVFLHLGLPGTGELGVDGIASHAASFGVHYLGFKENVLDYISACHVAVLPSWYREGVPRSLIEALSLDKYLITTDTPGCRETVREGWNGVFCRAGDPRDLALKLLVLDDLSLRRCHGRSRALCEEKFDVRRQIDITLERYAGGGVAHG